MEPELRERIFEHYLYCLPEGEMIIAYPVPGPDNDVRPGRRSYNWVWYHPVEAGDALRALCTDGSAVFTRSASRRRSSAPRSSREIRGIAREVLAPQIAVVIERTPQPFFQAIYDLEAPRLVQGRVALLGDAAFVARPHVGMGVTKAALDASVSLTSSPQRARRLRGCARALRREAASFRNARRGARPQARQAPRSADEQAARARGRLKSFIRTRRSSCAKSVRGCARSRSFSS